MMAGYIAYSVCENEDQTRADACRDNDDGEEQGRTKSWLISEPVITPVGIGGGRGGTRMVDIGVAKSQ